MENICKIDAYVHIVEWFQLTPLPINANAPIPNNFVSETVASIYTYETPLENTWMLFMKTRSIGQLLLKLSPHLWWCFEHVFEIHDTRMMEILNDQISDVSLPAYYRIV